MHENISKPIFSVIVPVYNREHLIVGTLNSIKNQTYRPIELVIVDDGSSDESARVISEWLAANQVPDSFEVRYLYQENAGVASARNYGLRESEGEYVYFLDSDDRVYPDALLKVAEAFNREQADMVLTGYDIADEETGSVTASIYGCPGKKQLEHVIKGEVCVVTLRSFFKRSLLEATGYWNETMSMSEDTEFIQRALCLSKHPVGIRDIVASLRRGGIDHRSFDYNQPCRVHCNELFLSNVLSREDVSIDMKRALVSKMARLSCKLRLMGERSLAKRCTLAALSAKIQRTPALHFRLLLCQTGLPGSLLFAALYKARSLSLRWNTHHA